MVCVVTYTHNLLVAYLYYFTARYVDANSISNRNMIKGLKKGSLDTSMYNSCRSLRFGTHQPYGNSFSYYVPLTLHSQ